MVLLLNYFLIINRGTEKRNEFENSRSPAKIFLRSSTSGGRRRAYESSWNKSGESFHPKGKSIFVLSLIKKFSKKNPITIRDRIKLWLRVDYP